LADREGWRRQYLLGPCRLGQGLLLRQDQVLARLGLRGRDQLGRRDQARRAPQDQDRQALRVREHRVRPRAPLDRRVLRRPELRRLAPLLGRLRREQ
jgi:hypothetical protein